jgi:hypothetical protein
MPRLAVQEKTSVAPACIATRYSTTPLAASGRLKLSLRNGCSSDRALKGSVAEGGLGGLRTIQKCTPATAARAKTAAVMMISHPFLVTLTDCMRWWPSGFGDAKNCSSSRLFHGQPCSRLPYAPIESTGAGMATLPLKNWSVASIRQTSGISLEEIARNTKLKVTTLKAIEDANFDVLPGGIYNISYIRQYARAIGVDEGALVRMYQSLRPEDNQSQADGR